MGSLTEIVRCTTLQNALLAARKNLAIPRSKEPRDSSLERTSRFLARRPWCEYKDTTCFATRSLDKAGTNMGTSGRENRTGSQASRSPLERTSRSGRMRSQLFREKNKSKQFRSEKLGEYSRQTCSSFVISRGRDR